MYSDTIAATATARGSAGISVIRISGAEAFSIGEKVFRPAKGDFASAEAGKAQYGTIISDGAVIDDGIALKFAAPRSYTGEDVVELSCHGSPYLTRKILGVIMSHGARLAERGEFTKRAYLNGKISLTGAEAVGRLIAATNETSARLAYAQSKGGLSAKLGATSEIIRTLLSEIYVTADFPDENLSSLQNEELTARVRGICDGLRSLAATYETGRIITEGIRTSLIGKPNTGKSTVLNLLSRDDIAIVHNTPGTTRDIVTASVNVGNFTLNLFDTAGIRTTDSEIENIGIQKTLRKIDESELIIGIFDISGDIEIDDHVIKKILDQQYADGKKIVIIFNKYDAAGNPGDLQKFRETFAVYGGEPIVISARDNTSDHPGADAYSLIKESFSSFIEADGDLIDSGELLTEERQHTQVTAAAAAAEQAHAVLLRGGAQDAAALDLEAALTLLDSVDAKSIADDMVDRIFRNFCVGK